MGTIDITTGFVTETCCHTGCGVLFAFTRDYYNQVHGHPERWWYCPNGHQQHYNGKSDAQKLEDAKVREVALRDQVSAAVRDAEMARVALLRDRQRFANGVCPCCNRSFENVRRHMTSKHPDYDVTKVKQDVEFKCSCGRGFGSLHGLRIHQGRSRYADGSYAWDKPNQSTYWSHLTKV